MRARRVVYAVRAHVGASPGSVGEAVDGGRVSEVVALGIADAEATDDREPVFGLTLV